MNGVLTYLSNENNAKVIAVQTNSSFAKTYDADDAVEENERNTGTTSLKKELNRKYQNTQKTVRTQIENPTPESEALTTTKLVEHGKETLEKKTQRKPQILIILVCLVNHRDAVAVTLASAAVTVARKLTGSLTRHFMSTGVINFTFTSVMSEDLKTVL